MKKVSAQALNQRAVIYIDASDEFARAYAHELGYRAYEAKDARGMVCELHVFTTPQRAKAFVEYCA